MKSRLPITSCTVHYNDVIMGAITSQITSLTIVYSTVYSGADQRKHQSSASLAFVRGIHRGPVNSPHKGPVARKCFHLMTSSCYVIVLKFCSKVFKTIKQPSGCCFGRISYTAQPSTLEGFKVVANSLLFELLTPTWWWFAYLVPWVCVFKKALE